MEKITDKKLKEKIQDIAGRLSYQASQEVEVFEDEVTLSSGVDFDHRDTLKKINKHKRLKFHNCSDENAVFWALGFPRQVKFSAKLDFDTRHFEVEGYGDFNYYQAWVCNVRFRKYVKDTAFYNVLDDVGDALSDFGSTALKIKEDRNGRKITEECDLMKLWFDPTIKDFYKQTKIELHELCIYEVLEKNWDNKRIAWDKAEVVNYGEGETEKNDAVNTVAEKRKFWERVGYFNVAHYKNEDLVNGEFIPNSKEQNWKFMHTIHSGHGADEVIVFAEEIKPEEDIYVDFHIGKYEDRWLRIGVYERLFPIQKLANEAVNYDKQAQQIASLLLFRTRNKKIVGSNILHEAESGLITDSDLEQIGIQNTFLNDFINKLAVYEKEADRLCSLPDMVDLNQKTFRGLAAQLNIANSAFKKSRDRTLGKLADLIIKRLLPPEVKKWNREKALTVAGFEIDIKIFDALLTISKLIEYITKEFKKGNNPTEEEKITFVERLRNRIEIEGRKIKLPKDFFNFKFGLGINASNESEHKEQQNDAYFNVIQWILANPAVNYVPAFREYCEKNNITPFHLSTKELNMLETRATGQPQPVGGGKDKLMSQIDTNE